MEVVVTGRDGLLMEKENLRQKMYDTTYQYMAYLVLCILPNMRPCDCLVEMLSSVVVPTVSVADQRPKL